MTEFSIVFSERSKTCKVIIGQDLLFSDQLIQSALSLAKKFVIIADSTAAKLYGNDLLAFFRQKGLDAFLLEFSGGENNKTRHTKELLEDKLLEKGYGRDTCLLALGGGVVTDLVGYIAATYCRGLPLILLPTTLLAMVDASIGGKNGVNTSLRKNAIGTIYQPSYIFMDLQVLKSLSITELKNGFAEMIKHGLIANSSYFWFLEKHLPELQNLQPDILQQAIIESCKIKQKIVEQDEKESGPRALLNFGHTFGHAIESLFSYKIPHGQAVALGIVFESYLSWKMGFLDEQGFRQTLNVLKTTGFKLQTDLSLSADQLLPYFLLDKKTIDQKPQFVLLEQIGKPKKNGHLFTHTVDQNLITQAIDDALRLY